MMAPTAMTVGRSPWPLALLVTGLAIAAVVGLHWPTFASMVAIWSRSDTFAHAFLVAPISAWLVLTSRGALAQLTPAPQPLWLAPTAGAAVLWLLGDLAGVNAAAHFGATAMLVLVVPTLLGTAVARAIAFPLAFLFFMVPVGEFLMPQLMEWTADFAVAGLRLVGVPVFREGLQFMIPTGNWSVIETCSGVRYLIASFMVGVLFAHLNYRSLRRRIAFAAFALVVPVVANWLRAFLIVMLGHLSGNRLAVGVDHLVYGWIFFGIVVAIMFAVGTRWREPPAPASERLPNGAPVSAGPASVSMQLVVLALTALVSGAPIGLLGSLERPRPPLAGLQLPPLAGLEDAAAPVDYAPVFERPAGQAQRSYAVGGDTVTVHVAYYRQQRYGSKLGSAENTLVKSDDRRWRPTAQGRHHIDVEGRVVEMRTAQLRSGDLAPTDARRQRLYVDQVYWVDGHLTASAAWATMHAVAAQLAGRGDDAAALTVHVLADDPAAARRILDTFLHQHLTTVSRFLFAVRDQP